ncbi:MAG: hypothetical protein QXK30_01755 [Candidatus Bathyarchaeia archaeon]
MAVSELIFYQPCINIGITILSYRMEAGDCWRASRPYRLGWRYCRICGYFIKTEDRYCPLCGLQFRTNPRERRKRTSFLRWSKAVDPSKYIPLEELTM